MGFYYISVFSVFLLGAVYAVLLLVFWGIARLTRGMPGRKALLGVVGAVFLVLPVAEELWTAWNFGQACKQAGTFIYKKVEVEGFYDDTMGWGPRQLAASKYRFVESKDILYQTLSRVERADDAARDRALAWYAEQNPGKERPKDLFVVHSVDDREQVAVAPNGVDAWRIIKLDRPTARYHYRWPHRGTVVSYKVGKSESVVIDTEAGEVIARNTVFGRRAPWFFAGLDVPPFACDSPSQWPYARSNPLVYRDALIPIRH